MVRQQNGMAIPAAQPVPRRAVRCGVLVLAAVGLIAGLYVIATTPPTRASIYPKCTFHAATGWHCPGCGTGRALHFALNGQFLTAAQFNIVSLIALPLIAISLMRSLAGWALGRPLTVRHTRARWLWLLIAGLLLFSLARNIPVAPFTDLAPRELESVDRQ